MRMENWLAASARTDGERLALHSAGETWSYAALAARAAAMAGGLREFGLQMGDRAALLGETAPLTAAALFALGWGRAVAVPLNTRLHPDEAAWQANAAECRLILTTARHRQLAERIAGGRPVVLVETLSGEPAPAQSIVLDAVQSVVFTSGTTGRPKGAQITWGNHLQVARGTAARLGVLPEDRWLTCLPLYHVGGMSILFRAALFATGAVLHDGFDAARANADLDSGMANIASFVPTMLARVLDERGERPFPASVRLLLVGGAAIGDALLKRTLAIGAPVALTYGLSEAASQVATAAPEDVRRKPGTVGRALRGADVGVMCSDGRPAAPGEIGEIVVRGPVVMAGYLGADPPRDGLHTGDLGYLDDAGDLWVVQRRDDLIISGGENIYPAEVEKVLREHPSVADALVVAIEDAEWTQLPAALIVSQSGHAPDAQTLDAWCRERLARYKRPRRYHFVDALPMTSNGKISRALARVMLADDGRQPQS